MLRWLYRHLFRGVGILFLAGLLTILFLAASFLSHRPSDGRVQPRPKVGVHR